MYATLLSRDSMLWESITQRMASASPNSNVLTCLEPSCESLTWERFRILIGISMQCSPCMDCNSATRSSVALRSTRLVAYCDRTVCSTSPFFLINIRFTDRELQCQMILIVLIISHCTG